MNLPELTLGKVHLKFSLIVVFAGLLIGFMFAVAYGGSTAGLFDVGTATVQAASQTLQDELQLELNTEGFKPAQVQRAAGTFAIAVENSVISGDYTLQLKAHDGTVIKEVQVQQGSAAWTITLAAGDYTLTETTHPQWLCQITVQ
jgi:hypothetical protein